jgi:sodium pump decarboxylase gamma subunit
VRSTDSPLLEQSRSTDLFDQDLLNDGLTLSLVGMGVVFAVLALLAISIKGISLLDREPKPAETAEAVSVAATPALDSPVLDGKITGQEVAAIAVALALSEPKSAPMSSSISRAGNTAGSWLQSGRMRMLGSSSSVRERRG